MNVRPLNDRVLVKRLAEEEKTAGGLFIPDSAKEKPTRGKVVAVGSGRANDEGTRKPLDVKAGDEILFGKYAGTEIKLDGEELPVWQAIDGCAGSWPSCSTFSSTTSLSQSRRISRTFWKWPDSSPLCHSRPRERLQ